MKIAWLFPFVLLLGLIIGGWAPKRDIQALQKEMDALRNTSGKSGKDSQLGLFTHMAKIPDRATQTKAKPPRAAREAKASPAAETVATNAAPVAVAAQPRPDAKPAEHPHRERVNPEDLQARINEAKELWKTRVDVARAQWIDRLKLSADQTAAFDEAINGMNEQLYQAAQNFAETLKASDSVTPADGVRAFNEMTSTLVQTYDALGAVVPEAQAGEAAQIDLTDFIDPAVAEPLITVQDKLEKAPNKRGSSVKVTP
jgi:hypothetical protein